MRYGLRTALIAMAILCGVMAWWTNRARARQSAIRRIIEAGGRVEYSHFYEPIHNDSWVRHGHARTIVPGYVRRLVGDDYFTSVIGVELSYDRDHPVDIDELMSAVGQFNRLRFLTLINQELTDAGVRHVADLTLLEKLDLEGARISDDGMRHLARLDNLVELWLGPDSAVSDTGLKNARISDKRRLRILDLGWTAVSDEGLLMLTALPNLWLLDVNGTNVTENGLRTFKEARPDVSL